MAERDLQKIVAGCDRFLNGYPPYKARQRMLDIANHPWAEIRNDNYGRGGALAMLEEEIALLLGKEAAVFMPSGTMAQPIALRIWSDRAECPTVAFHPTCHLELHEHHAYRELHHLEAVLLGSADRLFTLADFQAVDRPLSTLLIELPQREIGGQLPTWSELASICDVARTAGTRTHLDGARLWECAPYYARSCAEICDVFDSVYVSFYKILHGLPGAALAGPADFIAEARIWQRRHGGNLQQQTQSVISAKLGMERWLPRIPEYVAKAAEMAAVLRSIPGVRLLPEDPPTNMMHVFVRAEASRLEDAALDIAESERVWMPYGWRQRDGEAMYELSIASGALEFSRDEIRSLFDQLLSPAK